MTDESATSEPDRPVPGPVSPHVVTPAVPLMSQEFTATTVTALRHALRTQVAMAGLTGDLAYDFVLAVHELVTNAVRHGGGRGQIDLRRHDDVLICEITDRGAAVGELPVRLPTVDTAGGRGLWLAQQLTDGLILTRHLEGVSATVTVCVRPADDPAVRPTVVGGHGAADDDQKQR
ncbi:ATP-binding protein [Micromonospora psammae]|uniref:ATP-binding protein n=1 Tax=Micromonospora sp. CPCC 205556 TaxID=3122398 RepID=UPI002FF38612